MIVVWRGKGALAFVPAYLPAVLFTVLTEFDPMVAMFFAGLSAIGGGIVCIKYGRKWNRGTRFHSLYWMTMQEWGWFYVLLGGFFAGLVFLGWLKVRLVG